MRTEAGERTVISDRDLGLISMMFHITHSIYTYVYTIITKSRYRLVLEYKVMPHSSKITTKYHPSSDISLYYISYHYRYRYPTRVVHFIIVSLGIVIDLFLREDKNT